MAKLFKFEVVTPHRVFHSDDVEMIVFDTIQGEMGVLADHVPMLIANIPCVLKIQNGKEKRYAYISEGFIEISPSKVTAIVDVAEWADEIDLEQAIKDKKLAEEKLYNEKQDLQMKAELRASIERSARRIKTAETIRQ